MAKLGYVGLGAMGGLMAERLMSKGHSLVGYNRTKSRAQWLVDKGMGWSESPRGVAEASDATFVMVTNSAALDAVASGPDGLLAGLGAGKLLIDMSTVSPAASRALAAQVRARGADMVDAPVSGSVVTLQQGKLSIMVGGEKPTFERVKPLLEDVGPRVTHVGGNGLALSMKIATNLSLMAHMLAFSEGVLLAEKSGIPREVAVDVLTHSVIASPMVQYRGPFVLRMPDEAWFDVNMMQKDMPARPGDGAAARRAAADHRHRQRDAHRRAGHGLRPPRLRDCLRRARADVRSSAMSVAAKKKGDAIGVDRLLHMYRQMVAIRLFEERVNDLYTRALMPGLAHLYIGEEAIAVGICEALNRDDYITSTHRGHGHCLAKGASPDRMFAELLGKRGRLLQGQGRIDAHRRPGHRQPGGQRDCLRQRGASRPARRSPRSTWATGG